MPINYLVSDAFKDPFVIDEKPAVDAGYLVDGHHPCQVIDNFYRKEWMHRELEKEARRVAPLEPMPDIDQSVYWSAWDPARQPEITSIVGAVPPQLSPGATRHPPISANCLQLPSGADFMIGIKRG
jgi:hypothetical protein